MHLESYRVHGKEATILYVKIGVLFAWCKKHVLTNVEGTVRLSTDQRRNQQHQEPANNLKDHATQRGKMAQSQGCLLI